MTHHKGIMSDKREWTPAEDAALRARYGTDDAKVIASDLGRSLHAVFHRAYRLRVTTRPRWTADDDRILRRLWGEDSVRRIAERLGRTPIATYYHAREIGLRCGVPQGLEYLKAAAERTGYETGQLRAILRWAGVGMTPAPTAKPLKHPRHFHVVDPFDVDEAIARWHETETLTYAAKARGLGAGFLKLTLELFAKELPPHPTNKRHWRIPTTVIDAAIAARADHETIAAAARRVGLHRGTLRHRAVVAGLGRGTGKLWFIRREDADRLAGVGRSDANERRRRRLAETEVREEAIAA